MKRPHTLVVLAMTVDGKIADYQRSPARFGSSVDKSHLERQISQVDGVLFGAGTLRAYQTSLPITNPNLLNWRHQQGKPPQPVHIVCSASGDINPNWRFFGQNIPRWLLTTSRGFKQWQEQNSKGFERVLVPDDDTTPLNWCRALEQLSELGLERLAILGGGELVASLLQVQAIDELSLTLCPWLFGGRDAPTPIEGIGLTAETAQRLDLVSLERVEGEIFLHYRLK